MRSIYPADVSRERAKLMRSQRRKIDLMTRRLRGELVEVSIVEATWCRLAAAFRSRLLTLPVKVAPLLVGQEVDAIRAKLEEEAREVLAEFAAERFLREAAGLK